MWEPPKSEVIALASREPANSAGSTTPRIGSVRLRGVDVPLETEVARQFILDCSRYLEGSLLESDLKEKYQLTGENWDGLAANAPLRHAVHAERERRIINGEATREAAQRHFTKAPDILNRLLTDEHVAPRHRIEAARELRQAAVSGPDISSGPKEKVTITINLGADTEVYEKFIDPRGPSLPDDGESV
jgi:hypothetical protein